MAFDIANMLKAEVFPHPVKQIQLIETHISWVILTGDFAYKLKKPVDFGFLDFSTLELRRTCCEQELQLNRRLAPDIYLDVVTINGSPDAPRISGSGDIVEYAVKMRQFPQSAQLDVMLAAGELEATHMDAIARMTAEFHQRIAVADDAVEFGSSTRVYYPVEENFRQIGEHMDTSAFHDKLEALRIWSEEEFNRLQDTFAARKADGFVRECHGDMHLRNMLWLNDKPMAFDCIEFNASLRWNDVISEVAFLVMDLQDRQQLLLANRFLNSYLEHTGDYSGLAVLPFYLTYRAMVRAKVCALRLEQGNINSDEKQQTESEFESYLDLAATYTQQTTPVLIIMCGLSGSGKSTVSQQLLDRLGAIRIRSDVERKRLYHVAASASNKDEIDSGLYSAQASQRTYEKLIELCSAIITAGFSVIVDAAFLNHEKRAPFQKLAADLAVPYRILELTAPDELLRERIRQRVDDVSDAGLEVLEHQLLNRQPLHEDEISAVITIDTTRAIDADAIVDRIEKH